MLEGNSGFEQTAEEKEMWDLFPALALTSTRFGLNSFIVKSFVCKTGLTLPTRPFSGAAAWKDSASPGLGAFLGRKGLAGAK